MLTRCGTALAFLTMFGSCCSTFSTIPACAETLVNVRGYGATGTGATDDTAAIARAVEKLPAAGGILLFPAGNYLISGRTVLPSNTRLRCEKAVITAAQASQWRDGRITSAFGASQGSNFEVEGCTFAFPYGTLKYGGGYAHVLRFEFVSKVNIHHNVFDGGGDAVAEIGTMNTLEAFNTATNVSNACFDHWGGFTNAHTNHNSCSTLTTAWKGVGGIQFTGIAKGGGIAYSDDFEAIANTITINNGHDPQCILINGSRDGGTDDHGRIIANRCVVTGGNRAWGILVTGSASHGEIADNTLKGNNGAYAAVAVLPGASDWNVHDNTAIDWIAGRKGIFFNDGSSGRQVNNRSCSDMPGTSQDPLPCFEDRKPGQ